MDTVTEKMSSSITSPNYSSDLCDLGQKIQTVGQKARHIVDAMEDTLAEYGGEIDRPMEPQSFDRVAYFAQIAHSLLIETINLGEQVENASSVRSVAAEAGAN